MLQLRYSYLKKRNEDHKLVLVTELPAKDIALREECLNFQFFKYLFSRIRTEYGPEKTPNWDTYHAESKLSFVLISHYF